MRYPLMPMDVALVGLEIWRKQAQTAAMATMTLSTAPHLWASPASDTFERLSESQVAWAKTARAMSLSFLEAAASDHRKR